MGWFSLGRSEGFPSQYPPNQTPVTVDVLEAGFITAFIILAICFFISLPNRRLKSNINLFIRISLSLLIGLFIILGNFGQEWEVAHINSKTPYRIGTGHEINASIGLKIGLRSINVTLKSTPEEDGVFKNEIIDYNERFEWTWDQGRFGFGPYAGHLQQQFRAAQYRGSPLPILWVVDYFVIDGEGFRFGRFYRTAGWYTHIVLWTAFPCWILANILFRSVIRHGAYFLFISGGLLLLGNLLWLVIRNPLPLEIPFEDATMTTTFGFSYWLTFCTGIVCIVLSIAILIFEAYYDTAISIFFGIDPLTSLDEFILTREELELLRTKNAIPQDMFHLTDMKAGPSSDRSKDTQTVYLKRNITVKIRNLPRSRKVNHVEEGDEQPLYGNMEMIKMQHDQMDHVEEDPEEVYGNMETINKHKYRGMQSSNL